MNKKTAHIINSLIADDMDDIKKLKKTDLLEMVKQLKVSLYLEMTDDTLSDIYEKRYNDIIDNMWGPYNRGVL